MAQLSERKSPAIRSVPFHPDDERALQRIHFQRSDWDKLNWYVQIARKPTPLSPGERLILEEEIRAVERTLIRAIFQNDGVPIHTEEDIHKLRMYFDEKLTELADAGGVTLGPFQTMIAILFGRCDEWSGGEGQSLLPYHFAQLLKKFPESIRRCRHCKNIFLAPRVSAYHCNRECQSKAASKALRERKKRMGTGSKLGAVKTHKKKLTKRRTANLRKKER